MAWYLQCCPILLESNLCKSLQEDDEDPRQVLCQQRVPCSLAEMEEDAAAQCHPAAPMESVPNVESLVNEPPAREHGCAALKGASLAFAVWPNR